MADPFKYLVCESVWSSRPEKGPDGEAPLCPDCSDALWDRAERAFSEGEEL